MPDGYIELPDWLKPAPPSQVEERPAKPDASRDLIHLLLPDGRRVAIAGRTLLGRDPQPRPGEPAAALVPTGADRSVSKTHALVEPAGPDALRLTDRGSTNRSAVVAPDGSTRACPPEVPVAVLRGERIRLGDVELAVE